MQAALLNALVQQPYWAEGGRGTDTKNCLGLTQITVSTE